MPHREPVKKELMDVDADREPDTCSLTRSHFLENIEPAALSITGYNDRAIELFESLGDEMMPDLPVGHKWVRSEAGKRSIVREQGAPERELEVITYGPENGKINYLFLVDGTTWQSFAHTRSSRGRPRARVDKVFSQANFRVPGYNYRDSTAHMRGHCIDDFDTMWQGGKAFASTYAKPNIIPEPHFQHWGRQGRRQYVAALRKEKKGYMQFLHYPEKALVTNSGTLVPDFGYFCSIDIDNSKPYDQRYKMKDDPIHFDWETDYKTLRDQTNLNVLDYFDECVTECSPAVKIWDMNASDRAARLELRNEHKRALQVDSESLATIYPRRDRFYPAKNAAQGEFESIRYGFNSAKTASMLKQKQTAAYELDKSLDAADDLIEMAADSEEKIVVTTEKQLKKFSIFFKNERPGFEDPSDEKQDRLDQIRRNLFG